MGREMSAAFDMEASHYELRDTNDQELEQATVTQSRSLNITDKGGPEISNETREFASFSQMKSSFVLSPPSTIARGPKSNSDATSHSSSPEYRTWNENAIASGSGERGLTAKISRLKSTAQMANERLENTIVNPSGKAIVMGHEQTVSAPRNAQANPQTSVVRTATPISGFIVQCPPGDVNTHTQELISELRNALYTLSHSSECEDQDKHVFHALTYIIETLEIDWLALQQMEATFKTYKDLAQRRKEWRNDSKIIEDKKKIIADCQWSEHQDQSEAEKQSILKSIKAAERKKTKLEDKMFHTRFRINAMEIEIAGLKSLLGMK